MNITTGILSLFYASAKEAFTLLPPSLWSQKRLRRLCKVNWLMLVLWITLPVSLEDLLNCPSALSRVNMGKLWLAGHIQPAEFVVCYVLLHSTFLICPLCPIVRKECRVLKREWTAKYIFKWFSKKWVMTTVLWKKCIAFQSRISQFTVSHKPEPE